MKFASFIWFLSLDIDRPPIKGSTSPHLSFNSANVGQISVKIPQFLGSGGRPVCNILVATQPLVSVWELLMGVGEMGKLPILLPPPLASSQSISLRGGKGVSRWKGHFGEERPGRYLHFAAHGTGGGGVLGVSAQCEKGWTVTKELCGFLAAVDQDWEDEGEQEGCAAVSSRVKQHVGWGRGWGVRRRVCRGYLSAM